MPPRQNQLPQKAALPMSNQPAPSYILAYGPFKVESTPEDNQAYRFEYRIYLHHLSESTDTQKYAYGNPPSPGHDPRPRRLYH